MDRNRAENLDVSIGRIQESTNYSTIKWYPFPFCPTAPFRPDYPWVSCLQVRENADTCYNFEGQKIFSSANSVTADFLFHPFFHRLVVGPLLRESFVFPPTDVLVVLSNFILAVYCATERHFHARSMSGKFLDASIDRMTNYLMIVEIPA